MGTDQIEGEAPPPSREELIARVGRAHLGSTSADSALAGAMLAANSRLPKRVAENLGAGFGQWDFFPEIADIVDFALAYVSPVTADDVWALARVWTADEANGRRTLMALVGREVVSHELRRIDVPSLRALVDETRPARARELRASLGLEVVPLAAAKAKPAPKSRAASPAPRTREAAPIPMRMPKAERKPVVKAAPALPPKRFQHPKFGEGTLVAQDGEGPDAKLTIAFPKPTGEKTLLARYVTDVPGDERGAG